MSISILRPVNTVMDDLFADAGALPAARFPCLALNDIGRQARPTLLQPQHGAHHHE